VRRLRSHWSEPAFAVAWVGALSVYWIHVKMNVRFQSVVKLGVWLPFPMSLIYVSAIYVIAIAVILWTGLGIYLAFAGGLSSRRLLRGLLMILIVIAPSLLAEFFLGGLRLPPLLKYMATWLPLFFALWLAISRISAHHRS
jgi:hypothetical protein